MSVCLSVFVVAVAVVGVIVNRPVLPPCAVDGRSRRGLGGGRGSGGRLV